jgi:hypothetical protein
MQVQGQTMGKEVDRKEDLNSYAEHKALMLTQTAQDRVDRGTLIKRFEGAFRAQFKKLENILVVARSIRGNAGGLRTRANAAARHHDALRTAIDDGSDIQVLKKHARRVSQELYSLRMGLTDIEKECHEIKKYANMDVNLESYWHDQGIEVID